MRLAYFSLAFVVVVAAIGGAGQARADIAEFEHQFGATDVNAAIGNGRVSAAFSSQGELTVLRWPSTTYYQHVSFQTSTATNARQLPHFGARDDMGSFAGVYVAPGPGGTPAFAWARDTGWTVTQSYAADDSNQLVTALHNAQLQVTVTYTDDVAPDADVLVRRVQVTPDAGFTPTALRLVYFENFVPMVEKGDYLPTDETSEVDTRDYALGMSQSLGALVHFSVNGRPPALITPLTTATTPAQVDGFLTSAIAGKNGATDGTYIVLGGDHAPDGFQCGWDLPPAPTGEPEDAYQQAIDGVGTLASSPAVTQHADGALAWNLPTTGGAVDVFIAFGGSYEQVTTAFTTARTRGGDAIRTADLAYWKTWLSTAALPATTDPDRLRIAKRTLLSIATARDAGTGAIVASLASQPPYNLDWPRDGSFIDYALDLAGYHDLAGAHRMFYANVQRKTDGQDVLGGGDAFAGSFAMDYYSDGAPGGPIPLEIDEVGLTLWGWYQHATFIAEPARTAYLNAVYPSVVLAANMLTTCVDPTTGLQCLEEEDDNPTPTITLHGAIATHAGLAAAVRTAMYLGRLDDARRWSARLNVLDAAIEKQLGDPTLGYVGGSTNLGDVGAIGPVAWTLWPARLHPSSDARIGLAAQQIVQNYTPFFNQTDAGGAYFGKGLVALALYYGPTADGGIGDAAGEAMIQTWIDLMVKEVATTGTGHYGESFEYNGGTSYTDVVCIPHIWEGTLTYLSLMAAYSPDTFAPPDIGTLDVPAPSSGCRTEPGTPVGPAAIAILVLVGASATLLVRRRRR
jgi:hypothetical protein